MSSRNKHIVIVDYGLGNLHSIQQAVKKISGGFDVDTDGSQIGSATHLILPGVGAFAESMSLLHQRNQVQAIINFAKSGRPLLGICLGAQLLLETSEEFGNQTGLGLIQGSVQLIKTAPALPVPNVGWHKVAINKDFAGYFDLKEFHNEWMYFVHSYHAVPHEPSNLLAKIQYGSCKVTAAIAKLNCIGFQFHPEKSGINGIAMLKKFLDLKPTEPWK